MSFYNKCFDWAAMTLGNFDLAESFAVYMTTHHTNVTPNYNYLTESGIIFTHGLWQLDT